MFRRLIAIGGPLVTRLVNDTLSSLVRRLAVLLLSLTALVGTAALTVDTTAAHAAQSTTITAGIDTSPAVAAFRAGAHVYVYAGGRALLDTATEATVTAELAHSNVYLTVLRTPLGEVDVRAVSDAIAAQTGRVGHYVLMGVGGSGTYMTVSSPIAPHIYGLQLRQAFAAHHDHPAAAALALVTALKGDKLPHKSVNAGPIVAGACVLLLLILLVAVDRSRRRAARTRRAVRVNHMAEI